MRATGDGSANKVRSLRKLLRCLQLLRDGTEFVCAAKMRVGPHAANANSFVIFLAYSQLNNCSCCRNVRIFCRCLRIIHMEVAALVNYLPLHNLMFLEHSGNFASEIGLSICLVDIDCDVVRQ